MATIDCVYCTPELKFICEIIGWFGCVANIIFGVIFFYHLHNNIGPFGVPLGFVIVTICHWIGSICLLVSIKGGKKVFFIPWVISNLAALVLLMVGSFAWDMYYNLIMVAILLLAQTYVWKYIAERILNDRGIYQLNA